MGVLRLQDLAGWLETQVLAAVSKVEVVPTPCPSVFDIISLQTSVSTLIFQAFEAHLQHLSSQQVSVSERCHVSKEAFHATAATAATHVR